MNTAELNALAHDIAYHAARSDIESHCIETFSIGGVNAGRWYYVKQLDHDDWAEDVAKAVTYLEARGLLRRHTHDTNLVRPLDAKEAVV